MRTFRVIPPFFYYCIAGTFAYFAWSFKVQKIFFLANFIGQVHDSDMHNCNVKGA